MDGPKVALSAGHKVSAREGYIEGLRDHGAGCGLRVRMPEKALPTVSTWLVLVFSSHPRGLHHGNYFLLAGFRVSLRLKVNAELNKSVVTVAPCIDDRGTIRDFTWIAGLPRHPPCSPRLIEAQIMARNKKGIVIRREDVQSLHPALRLQQLEYSLVTHGGRIRQWRITPVIFNFGVDTGLRQE